MWKTYRLTLFGEVVKEPNLVYTSISLNGRHVKGDSVDCYRRTEDSVGEVIFGFSLGWGWSLPLKRLFTKSRLGLVKHLIICLDTYIRYT